MCLLQVLLICFLALQYVRALSITFPSTPTAAQNNTFNWVRESNDPNNIWLRKQKLDDLSGVTPWTNDTVQLNLELKSSGSVVIYFLRAGLFNVGVFSSSDYPITNDKIVSPPIQVMLLTVSVNPTSAGAIPLTTQQSSLTPARSDPPPTLRVASGSSGTMSSGTIAAFSAGSILALITAGILIYICRRHRRRPPSHSVHVADPPLLTPFALTLSKIREAEEEARRQFQSLPPNAPHRSDTAVGNEITNMRNPHESLPEAARLVRRREVIQHEDSGWRPPETVSESRSDHQPIELPPTYDDSTRRVEAGGNGGQLRGDDEPVPVRRGSRLVVMSLVVEETTSGK
ncbi:hypothetical protein L218DRAFT_992211 [Marasmius fiardii PR-910]|nr:hypothetical protein L218DRAFT_992211 [Marasmius fiardii PR-910]